MELIMSGIYGSHPEDRYFENMLNKHLNAIDAQDKLEADRIEELKDEYLDDEEQLFEVLISEEFVDFEAVQSTIRALVCAHKYGRDESLVTFAKSLAQQILDGVDKKAEWVVTK
jgi:hypothetical protein